ncbi:MAG: hypothetical protein AB7P99_06400 [Vicinamibacterales bacterium]
MAFEGARAIAHASRPDDHGVFVNLPNIPLWVPDEARKAIESLVAQTLRLAIQEMAGRVSGAFADRHNDTGNTAQSFTADPASSAGGIELIGQTFAAGAEIQGRVFSTQPGAVVLNDGRRPGAPISRDGIEAIGLWAQRKLGLSPEEARHAKWAIAGSIIAQGIPGSGYFEKGIAEGRPAVEQMFAVLSTAVAEALVTPQGGA